MCGRREKPEVQRIEYRSSADGSMQPAMWYDRGGDDGRPLVVGLHPWSADFTSGGPYLISEVQPAPALRTFIFYISRTFQTGTLRFCNSYTLLDAIKVATLGPDLDPEFTAQFETPPPGEQVFIKGYEVIGDAIQPAIRVDPVSIDLSQFNL